jgi:hypothetical protein
MIGFEGIDGGSEGCFPRDLRAAAGQSVASK